MPLLGLGTKNDRITAVFNKALEENLTSKVETAFCCRNKWSKTTNPDVSKSKSSLKKKKKKTHEKKKNNY